MPAPPLPGRHHRHGPLEVAQQRYRAASREAERMQAQGLPVLAHQARALDAARRWLDRLAPGASAPPAGARQQERGDKERDFGMEL